MATTCKITFKRDPRHRIGPALVIKLYKVPRTTRTTPMNLREWSESEVEYGRKVLNSGLAGARSGQEAFLNGRPLTPLAE
jgi:hypothetical protein